MKSFVSALLFGAALAVPANNQKRSLIIVEEVVTQWTTVTIYGSASATASASKKQGAFFEFPSSFTLAKPTNSAIPSPSVASVAAFVAPAPTPSPAAVKAPEPAAVAAPAPVVAAPAPAKAAPASSGGPSGTGEITFYDLGLVSCGQTYKNSDNVVALSNEVMKQYGGNPNNNPLCGKPITINYNGKTVTGTVVDTCMGCAANNIDLSPSLFNALADPSSGRVPGVSWSVAA